MAVFLIEPVGRLSLKMLDYLYDMHNFWPKSEIEVS
jgi:hypothetical protein